MEARKYKKIVENLTLGKMLPAAIYLHADAMELLPADLLKLIWVCRQKFDLCLSGCCPKPIFMAA